MLVCVRDCCAAILTAICAEHSSDFVWFRHFELQRKPSPACWADAKRRRAGRLRENLVSHRTRVYQVGSGGHLENRFVPFGTRLYVMTMTIVSPTATSVVA